MTDPNTPPAAPSVRVDPSVLAELGEVRWRDHVTGLVVVPAPNGPLHRVFQRKYSALNPPIPGGDRATWSRWDVLDHVTLYGADDDVTAVVEALAYATPARLDLVGIFDDIPPDEDPISGEWHELGHMARGQIARAWRVARELTIVRLYPGAVGWFVDVGHRRDNRRTASRGHRLVTRCGPGPRPDTSRHKPARKRPAGRHDRRRGMAAHAGPRRRLTALRRPVHLQTRTEPHLLGGVVPLLGETGQDLIPTAVGRFVTADSPMPLLEATPALLAAGTLLGLRVP